MTHYYVSTPVNALDIGGDLIDLDVEVASGTSEVLIGLWGDLRGLAVRLTPDEARELVETIHFAIIRAEGGNDEDR